MTRLLSICLVAALVLAAADVYKIKFESTRQSQRLVAGRETAGIGHGMVVDDGHLRSSDALHRGCGPQDAGRVELLRRRQWFLDRGVLAISGAIALAGVCWFLVRVT